MVSSPAPSTYYVNSSIGRDDSTAGNRERPFKTIHFTLTQVRYGDQIKLALGKYNASSGERFPLRILAGVKILADDSLKKEVDRGKGIEIQGGGNYLSPSKGWKNATFWLEDSNVTLQDITAINPNGFGIWIESPAPIAPLVQNCTFKDCQKAGVFIADGIRPQIVNNTISGNGSSGIIVSGTSRPILRNNLIVQNRDGGLLVLDRSVPNLGSFQERGGNIFRENEQFDLKNSTANNLISNGNQLDPNRVEGPIQRLFRETLDLCTHRLDAWITSLATKRLHAMRQDHPTGIGLGAYGWVEDLKPASGQKQPQGFIILYLSASPPTGGETEIEQRIRYWVRETHRQTHGLTLKLCGGR